jgi:hypothetical protein
VIDITALATQLAEQDRALHERFSQIANAAPLDPASRAIIDTLAAGLAAINERQGNLITLMVRTNT